MKQLNLNIFLAPFSKIYSKWNMDLNIKPESINF